VERVAEPLVEPLTDIAPVSGPGTSGRVGGCGEGPPGHGRPSRRDGGLGGAGVGGPVGVSNGLGSTDDGRRRGPGAQSEGGGLFAVDDEAGRGGVGAEMRQVVLGDFGGNVTAEGVGVLGGHREPHLGPGVGRDLTCKIPPAFERLSPRECLTWREDAGVGGYG
jgi:hypothetical protein